MRGNVDTRLRKLEAGDYDCRHSRRRRAESPGQTGMHTAGAAAKLMCPAAGQGALAVEIRKDDSAVRQHVAFLDDRAARTTTACERALLNQMGGGCQVPIGALAEMIDGRLHLEAIVARPDGTKVLRESGEGDDPVQLGETVGEALLRRGGDAILQEVYGRTAMTPQQP